MYSRGEDVRTSVSARSGIRAQIGQQQDLTMSPIVLGRGLRRSSRSAAATAPSAAFVEFNLVEIKASEDYAGDLRSPLTSTQPRHEEAAAAPRLPPAAAALARSRGTRADVAPRKSLQEDHPGEPSGDPSVSPKIQPNPIETTARIGTSACLAKGLRSSLSHGESRHEEAANHFAFRFHAISITSVLLAASVGVLEAAMPGGYTKKLSIILVSALNTVLLTVANMKGYQSLKDRHAEAAQTYASMVSELDYKVIFPSRNHSWDMSTDKIDEYLEGLAITIRDLTQKVPPFPRKLKENADHANEQHDLKRPTVRVESE